MSSTDAPSPEARAYQLATKRHDDAWTALRLAARRHPDTRAAYEAWQAAADAEYEAHKAVRAAGKVAASAAIPSPKSHNATR